MGQGLLGNSGAGSVLQLIEQKGLAVAKQFLHTEASTLVEKHAAKIAAKMTSDGWKVGGTHKGVVIDAAAMVHDVLYRVVAIFVPRGGFVKDSIRDGLDHAMGAPLVPSVPAGDPTPEWVASVGKAAVDFVFGG
jgi:hypothetical protein